MKRFGNRGTAVCPADIEIGSTDLAGVAQWLEPWPVNQKVTNLIPSQRTFLGCGSGSLAGGMQEATDQCMSCTLTFLSLSFSLPSSLSKK